MSADDDRVNLDSVSSKTEIEGYGVYERIRASVSMPVQIAKEIGVAIESPPLHIDPNYTFVFEKLTCPGFQTHRDFLIQQLQVIRQMRCDNPSMVPVFRDYISKASSNVPEFREDSRLRDFIESELSALQT